MPEIGVHVELPITVRHETRIIKIVRPFRQCTSILYEVHKRWYSVRRTTIAIHFLSKEKFEIIDVTKAIKKLSKRN